MTTPPEERPPRVGYKPLPSSWPAPPRQGTEIFTPADPQDPEIVATRERWTFGGVSALVIAAILFVPRTEPMPDNALLYRDVANTFYLGPSCVGDRKDLIPTYKREVQRLEIPADPACKKAGGLTGKRFISLDLLIRSRNEANIRGTRWNPDGTWRW